MSFPFGSPPFSGPPPKPLYTTPGLNFGLIKPGNINLAARPKVQNPDGSYSTVKSISFTDYQGREVLVPQVVPVHGIYRVVPPLQAWRHYLQTGQHLGMFTSPAAANAYASRLHLQQARMYGAHPNG